MDDCIGSKRKDDLFNMSTKLGTAKVYFTKADLGKMLKLKDKENLMVTDVEVDNVEGQVVITITTPIDNSTNDRVKIDLKNLKIPKNKAHELLSDSNTPYSYEEISKFCISKKIEATDMDLYNIFDRALYSGKTLEELVSEYFKERYEDEKEGYNLKIFEHLKRDIFQLVVDTECNIKKSYWEDEQEDKVRRFVIDKLEENDIDTFFNTDEFNGIAVIDGKPVILIYLHEQELSLIDIDLDMRNNFRAWNKRNNNSIEY